MENFYNSVMEWISLKFLKDVEYTDRKHMYLYIETCLNWIILFVQNREVIGLYRLN
jgi:hypothetical protein